MKCIFWLYEITMNDVLMNGNVKGVENQGKNSECMHVKCKYIVKIIWNNFIGIKFHLHHQL